MSKLKSTLLCKVIVLLAFQGFVFSSPEFCVQLLSALERSKRPGFSSINEFSHNLKIPTLKLQEYSHNYRWFAF